MTGLRFLCAFVALPVLGLATWAIPNVARLRLSARIGIAAAAGAVLLSVEMFLFDLLELRWTVAGLALPLLATSAAGLMLARRHRSDRRLDGHGGGAFAGLALLAILLAAYAAATARATSADLLLFWGGKGARFAAHGGLDETFLTDPRNRHMHPDYPPLVTSLYAWAALVAGRVAWGAALLTMPFFLALTALAFWGLAREEIAPARASALTALLASLLSFASVVSLSAGNAEPALFFFETLALTGIVLGRGRRHLDAVIAIGLAGAVWTKVEGAAFAVLAAALFFRLHANDPTRWRRLLRVVAPAAGLLAAWIGWAARHEILQAYRGTTYGPFAAAQWKLVLVRLLETADYGVFYLPWVVLLLLPPLRFRNGTVRALVAAAAVYVLFIVFSYLHGSFDPSAWIGWSAERLLTTPLLFLFFASAAPAAEAE